VTTNGDGSYGVISYTEPKVLLVWHFANLERAHGFAVAEAKKKRRLTCGVMLNELRRGDLPRPKGLKPLLSASNVARRWVSSASCTLLTRLHSRSRSKLEYHSTASNMRAVKAR
jgi:hypothetical protein